MNAILSLSDILIPCMFLMILCYGYAAKIDVYNTFIEGAKDGMKTVFEIMPTIIGLMVAVGIIRASGALDLFTKFITPLTNLLRFPADVVPLAFMRLISSSASTGLVFDLFEQFGPDSFTGRFVSIMMCCTETVFYTLSVYFMSIGVKKTRYTLPVAIAANVAGIAASYWITLWLFGR